MKANEPGRNGHTKAAAAPAKARGPVSSSGDRTKRIAELLRDRGPLRMAQLIEAVGAAAITIRADLVGKPEWFRQTEPGNRLSPWGLTDEGRRAVAS